MKKIFLVQNVLFYFRKKYFSIIYVKVSYLSFLTKRFYHHSNKGLENYFESFFGQDYFTQRGFALISMVIFELTAASKKKLI